MQGITFLLNSAHWHDDAHHMPVARTALPVLPPCLLPNACTLEEVEQELLSSQEMIIGRPKVLFVEEVEEDLLNDPKNKSFHFGYPISRRPFHSLGEWEDYPECLFGPDEWKFSSSSSDEELYEMEYSSGEQADQFTSGFMTEKEKQWLIEIQLMAIETNDPYYDDYYFTVFKERKLGPKEIKSTAATYSPKVKHEEYQPAQVEGALGRLQIVSVNNPRKALESSVSRSPEAEEIYVSDKYLLEFRRLLLDIENMYLLLLKSEEKARMTLLPEELQNSSSCKYANKILKQIKGTFKERLHQIMSVSKGCRLVMRLLSVITPPKQVTLLGNIFSILVAVLSKENLDDILIDYITTVNQIMLNSTDEVMNVIENMEKFSKIDDILCECQNKFPPLVNLLGTKFGCNVICCLLKQGVKLYAAESSCVCENERWTNIIKCVTDSLCALPKDIMANHKLPFSDIISQMEQFPCSDGILLKQLKEACYKTA